MTNRPILAATMGDPAGIGPEICVRALLSPEVRDVSRSFVIGDARILQRALEVCGLSARLNRIAGPEALADQLRRPARIRQRRREKDVISLIVLLLRDRSRRKDRRQQRDERELQIAQPLK